MPDPPHDPSHLGFGRTLRQAQCPPGIAVQPGSTAPALAFVSPLTWLGPRALKRLQARRIDAVGASLPLSPHSESLGPAERLVSIRYRGGNPSPGVTPDAIKLIVTNACADRLPSPPPLGLPHLTVDPSYGAY